MRTQIRMQTKGAKLMRFHADPDPGQSKKLNFLYEKYTESK
jgi:hypothetical protein